MEPRSRGDARDQCGIQSSRYKRYLAETDTRQLFQWLTKVAHPEGTCQFTIGASPDSMQVLMPRNTETNSNGEFACGRKYGYESAEFKMPEKKCEDCFIELKYTYGSQKMYQCSDIRLSQWKPLPTLKVGTNAGHVNLTTFSNQHHEADFDTDAVLCGASACYNEGQCSDGVCYCMQGWEGPTCQIEAEPDNSVEFALCLLCLLLLVGIVSFLWATGSAEQSTNQSS